MASCSALALLDTLIADVQRGAAPAIQAVAPAAPAPASAPPAVPPRKAQQVASKADATSGPAPDASAGAGSMTAEQRAADSEVERKLQLLLSVGEECVTKPELRNLLSKKPNFVLYDGFEPSGRMHIAQGVFKAMNVNKCVSAGGTFIFWVADWFALMNDKMGGDLERIKTVGKYLIHVWTAAGMDMQRVKFLWSSEEITRHAKEYWTLCLDIARRFTVARITKCCQIMGRTEGTLTAAQILYPIMQCTDIFFLKADVCQLGVDQRKVNMLAREYCDAAGIKLKPIILSHHMLYGLSKGQAKMSKSNRDSAIFMEDTADEVARKLRLAYCPRQEGEVEDKPEEESMHLTEDKLKNPCLDYVQHIVFATPGARFRAGGQEFVEYSAVLTAFLDGSLDEEALKEGLIESVNGLLNPVRHHFEHNEEAKSVLQQITGWMQEPKGLRPAALRRLRALDGFKSLCVVFAPLPTARPTVAAAADVLRCLSAAPAGHQPVLWLADWSAFCLNCLCGGKTRADDLAAITAAYDVLVGALHALAPMLMSSVRIIRQGQVILENPSDYWISVINVGRAHSLNAIRALDESNHEVGQVISSLMDIANVLSVASPADSEGACCICALPGQEPLLQLALEYIRSPGLADSKLVAPAVHAVPSVSMRLKVVATDSPAAAVLDDDSELLLLDGASDVQRKMKKAFCEPGNADVCPPLVVASELVLPFSTDHLLLVKRREEDGGDKQYSLGMADTLREEFAAGALHPGDLKPAVRDATIAVLQRVQQNMQGPELAKAEKELAKVAKRTAKGVKSGKN